MSFLKHPALQPAALVARAAMIGSVVLTFTWIFSAMPNLGPTAKQPKRSVDGVSFEGDANAFGADSKRVVALHALMFTLAYVLCMTEALLAYRAPIFNLGTSRMTKWFHMVLHVAALVFLALGIVTSVLLKDKAVPKHDHYWSAHAWTGIMCCALSVGQFAYGLYVYMLSSWNVEKRQEHNKMHSFLGFAAYLAGLASCASGWAEENITLHLSTLEYKDNHSGYMLQATAAGALTFILGWAGVYVYVFMPQVLPQVTVEPFKVEAYGGEDDKEAGKQ